MTTQFTLPRSFVGGEMSPRMLGRPEDPHYLNGAGRLRNWYVDPTGAATTRPGTALVRELRNSDQRGRLLRFRVSSTGQDLQLELGFRQELVTGLRGYVRFHTLGSTLLHSAPWDAATAYAVGDQVTAAGVLYQCLLAHTNQAVTATTYWKSLAYVPNRPFAVGDVNTGTDQIDLTSAHGLVTDDPLEFTNDTGGAPIQYLVSPGVFANLVFGYAKPVSATVIQVSLTPGGSAVDIVGGGTGQPRLHRRYFHGDLTSQAGSVFYCRNDRPIDGSGLGIPPTSGDEAFWYLEPSTGELEVPTTLGIAEDNLFALTYSQQGNTMTWALLDTGPFELTRLGRYTWTFRTTALVPSIGTPSSVSAAATKRGATLAIATIVGVGPGSARLAINTTTQHRLVPGVDYVLIEGSAVAGLNNLFWGVEQGANASQFLPVHADTGDYFPFAGSPGGGGSVRVAELNSDTTSTYRVTAVDADRQESVPSTSASVTNNLFVSGAYNTVTWTAVNGASRYRVYKQRQDSGLYGFIGESTSLSFKDDNIAPDLGQTPPILDVSLVPGPGLKAPRAVTHDQGRRAFAATTEATQDVWMTRTNTEGDMSYSLPVKDTDRIHQRIKGRIGFEIRHLVPLGRLVALTDTTEFRITAIDGLALTPDSFAAQAQSYIGASRVHPMIMQGVLLFEGAKGGEVYRMAYSEEAGGYQTVSVCDRATHLFRGYHLKQMAEQLAPVPIGWCVSSNGHLLGVTFVPAQQVLAWHWHDSDGVFESVSVGNENGEDRVYAIVRRTINGVSKRFVERLGALGPVAQDQSWQVDCGLLLETTAGVSIVGGLGHLEGKEVAVFANGVPQGRQTVAAGQIHLALPLPAGQNRVVVGLPIAHELQTLPAVFAVDAFAGAKPKNLTKVWVRVEASGPFEIGPSLDNMIQPSEIPGVGPFSGLVEVRVPPDWTMDGQLFIRQTEPLPVTVVSIMAEMAVGGG